MNEERTISLTLSLAQAESLVQLLDAVNRANGAAVARQVVGFLDMIAAANQASLEGETKSVVTEAVAA